MRYRSRDGDGCQVAQSRSGHDGSGYHFSRTADVDAGFEGIQKMMVEQVCGERVSKRNTLITPKLQGAFSFCSLFPATPA